MTKRQVIDEIVSRNRTAIPGFLAQFGDEDLQQYLDRLRDVQTPPPVLDASRFDRYFEGCPASTADTDAVAEPMRERAHLGPALATAGAEQPEATQAELVSEVVVVDAGGPGTLVQAAGRGAA